MNTSLPGEDTIRSIQRALRDLHKSLLDVERIEYERSFGRIGSDFYLLQLAAEDPQFAWLRSLTGVMLEVDALVASREPLADTEMRLLGTRIRALLLADDRMTPFQHRYQAAMRQHPSVIMAHSVVMRLLPPASPIRIFRGDSTRDTQTQDDLQVQLHHPGYLIPGYGDHGYGALAVVAESLMPPGTIVPMHQHRNDEIISWVPEGVLRHDDSLRGELNVDPAHVLVMNTGRGFSNSERTLPTDPALTMLQVFIRPRAILLDPAVQFGPLPIASANIWRKIVGPEESDAPFTVRNAVEMYDIRMASGADVQLPQRDGWHGLVVVYEGRLEIDGVPLLPRQSALVQSVRSVSVHAAESSVVVAFLVNPDATVTRAGTVGR